MRIVVIGAGAVGMHLARILSWDGHEIIIVEQEQRLVDRSTSSMDVLAVRGSGTSISTLLQAGVRSADLLIAVTSVDEVNIVACMLAKQLGVKTCIARVRNQEYTSRQVPISLQELGISQIIHPEQEAAQEVVKLIRYQHAIDIVECAGGRMSLVGLKLESASPVLGKQLKFLAPQYAEISLRVVAIARQGNTIIPNGESYLQAGDVVYVITLPENLDRVFALAGKESERSFDVMLLGGGMIGRMVAEELEAGKQFNVKLVENDPGKSLRAAQRLVSTMVVRGGEGIDVDLLAIEGLADMGVMAALTDDDENNIVTSLFARHLKVNRTITLISKPEYMPIARAIGLDAAINTRLLTSDAILKYLRGGRIMAINSLRGIDAEIVEFQIGHSNRVVGKKLREITFPKGAIVGAIHHESSVEVAVGDSVIHPGDQVVVFCQEDAVPKLEKLFA